MLHGEKEIVIDQILDGSMSVVHCSSAFSLDEHARTLNIGVDYFEPHGLDLVQALAVVSPSENREATRLMDDTSAWLPGLVHPLLAHLTNEWTPPHPLLGVTAEPTIIWSPIDTLIREMIGWQTHEVPGGWTLKTPPRSTPRDWTLAKGVIRPQFTRHDDPFFLDRNALFVGYFGFPSWVNEERQSAFEREMVQEPISQCPDGHQLSGKSKMTI